MTANTLPVNPSFESEEEQHELRTQLMHDPRPREELNQMVMEAMTHATREYWIVVIILGLLTAGCLFGAWGYMIKIGIGLSGELRPSFWGLFISTFVFWIGISHAGTFVSAILRVFKAEFRRPFTRAAELMTTFGLAAGAMYPLIHLGRVWVSYWIFPVPNGRWLWPNLRSPLVWDMIAITTYLLGSTMYLFLPLLPDLAMAHDRSTGWRYVLYRFLSLGWRGTEEEWANLRTAIQLFAFAIIPVMFSVHTIVSWDFAVTKTVGWHSTIFGPFFIAGAIFSGVSAVVMVLYMVRTTMLHMTYFIREEHFDALGKLVLIFSFTWAYFYFNEYLLGWYGGDNYDQYIWHQITSGPNAWMWYLMLVCNIVIPWLTLWNKKIRRTPWAIFLICFMVNVGMYIERYLIVPVMITRNRFPFSWGYYLPRIELILALGSISLFLFLYIVMTRLIPIIPVWEVQEGQNAHMLRRVGKTVVSTVSDVE